MKAKKYWHCDPEHCQYSNGLVCNICWKQVYENFKAERSKENGENAKRNTEKNEDS